MDINQNNQNYRYISRDNARPPAKPDGFTIASFICGLCSIILCCTGVFSLPLGALGILFAVLSKRRGQRMEAFSITGVILSVIGMVLGLLLLIFYYVPIMLGMTAEDELPAASGNYYYDNYNDDFYDDYPDDDDFFKYYPDTDYDDYYKDYNDFNYWFEGLSNR